MTSNNDRPVPEWLPGASAMSTDPDGLVIMASDFEPKETMDRLEAAVRESGALVFARIDHSAGAAAIGLDLEPVELLIFGSARAGTPLMQERATIGIDLPLRALVWEDAASKTWLAYNDPRWLTRRHGISASVQAMVRLLGDLALQATRDPDEAHATRRASSPTGTGTRH